MRGTNIIQQKTSLGLPAYQTHLSDPPGSSSARDDYTGADLKTA
jgi:hypothetical protein